MVGDAQYGGALELPKGTNNPQLLALQCCELSFALPQFVPSNKREKMIGIPTNEWATFQLEDAWWTKHIRDHNNYEDSINPSL